ncbi:MAG TPA: hypothetical protein VE090_00540 [Methylomirabilota bacterium]|nr:hypothetical protein [Methylomirabilota bacterium]
MDDNLWFTEFGGNAIGRINLNPPTVTPTPTPKIVPLLKQGVSPYTDNDPSWENETLKVLEFPKPATDDYRIEISSSNGQSYQMDTSIITQERETKTQTLTGQLSTDTTNAFTLTYDKQSTEATEIIPIVITLQSLKADLQKFYEQGKIDNQTVYRSLKLKVDLAIQASRVQPEFLSKRLTIFALKAFLVELNSHKERHNSQEAYQVLKNETDFLINKYNN